MFALLALFFLTVKLITSGLDLEVLLNVDLDKNQLPILLYQDGSSWP